MEECDGMKTGFTRGAGFCITATAVRDGIRLIAVVMGANGKRDRFDLAQQLLEEGFGQVCKSRLIAKGDPVGDPVPIDNCEVPSVQLTAGDDLWVVVKKDDMDKLHVAPQLWARLQAPVRAGAALGEVEVQLTGKMIQSVPLTVSADVAEAGWRWKLIHGTVPRGTAPGHPQ
jgi:D-alanyl-D-alanine carboxypeptidase (penicillin-binding protein 5/6)